jgi:DNA-binding NarL/FixJ family response regulator
MSKTILIVDDHEIVRHFVRSVIRILRPEWEVCGEASDGKEAFEAIKTLKPDVVILDLIMPVMGGLEVTSRVHNLALKSRILVFTLHESRELAEEARKAGARGFVAKSRAGRDLIHAIDTVESGGTFFASRASN